MSDAPARAMPKSVTFARPSASTMTLCGLRSRWMIPRRCAKRAARRTWIDEVDRADGVQRRLVLDELLERAAVEVLHRDVVGAVPLAAVVDRDDVLVLEPGGVRRLAAEALDELLVLGEARVEELQRDACGRAGGPRRSRRRPCRPSRAACSDAVAAVDDRVPACQRRSLCSSSSHDSCLAIGAATSPPKPDARAPRSRRPRSAGPRPARSAMNQSWSLDLGAELGLGRAGLAGDVDALGAAPPCRCRSRPRSTIMSRHLRRPSAATSPSA